MNVAEKDAGEKNVPPGTTPPFPAVLPNSNSVPYLITHQVLPRNYGYVIRLKAKISRNFFMLFIYLYQTPHSHVKKNFP